MSELVKLGDYVDILTGYPFKSSGYIENHNGVRLLRGDNIGQGRIRWDNAKLWPADEFNVHKQYQLQAGDVVLAMDRPWIEAGLKCAEIRTDDIPSLLVQRVARLRALPGLDQRYLAYLIRSPRFTDYVLGVQTGTAVPHISAAQIRDFEFCLPPLRTQQAIAAVLGALDEKIAANEQIANSCDKLAEALLDQLLAEDPEVKKISLGEVAKVNPRTVKPVAGGYLRYIDISCVSAGRIDWPERLSWDKAPGRARRGVSPGDTIWSTVRPGRRSYALILDKDPEIVVSTGFVVLTPVKVGPAFLYEIVKRDAFVQYLENVAEGSAYPAVRPERFASAIIPLPSAYTLQRFEDAVMPFAVEHTPPIKNRVPSRSSATLCCPS